MSKYTGEAIMNMAQMPYNSLTHYQRKLVEAFKQPQRAGDIAAASGIPTRDIEKIIKEYRGIGLDPNSLRYLRDYGFIAKANNGRDVVFYVYQNQNGQKGYFGTIQDYMSAHKEVEQGKWQGSPPLDENSNIYIPQKEREEPESQFTDQEIVRLKGQVQYSAVSPEQRSLVTYMRNHPNVTSLKQARAGMSKR